MSYSMMSGFDDRRRVDGDTFDLGERLDDIDFFQSLDWTANNDPSGVHFFLSRSRIVGSWSDGQNSSTDLAGLG